MVFVLDKKKKPLMPCTEKRARKLLQSGRAVVHRLMPFVIRLKDRTAEESNFQPLRLKFDPGSKTTGFSLLREESAEKSAAIIMGEIHHKQGIKDRLDSRRVLRRGRRNHKTRYRKPRFDNRRREEGWLPPSLEARVEETVRAAEKLMKWLPITSISTEHVKFDTQLMQNPEISGIEYQQGELYGYEIREYLLEKYGRKCAYCGTENVPLQIEHVVPRNPKHGPKGTNRVSNLTISCERCNKDKGNKQPEEWLEELQKSKRKIDRVRAENLLKVLANLKKPLKDAAMMNATRWTLYERLKRTGLPVECGTGARTKKQRIEHGFPKAHYFDACCVGASTPKTIKIKTKYTEIWTAVGRGNRKMCNTDKYGFPISHRQRKKRHFGFQTGDIVEAEVLSGKYKGTWRGRVAVRASGYFDIKDSKGNRICQGISYRYVRLLQYVDGWQYEKEKVAY
ncbi:RNA-guided endonuclease IscB [Caldanaerobius polysaccharolyticus]|uniref:RNA-guided endonuclease IscB n=1 Tax=Caldanaerobius polysaccharolyticus TaxID=44256 RepID=UPI00047DFD83|nr:RNA-guided endonuclease IscB [Caldanaerobius polysaccharolyticus]